MKKYILLFILLLISISAVSAINTSDWKQITVNNVEFKIPPQYYSENVSDTYSKDYYHGYPYDFKIESLFLYKDLVDEYGMWSTSKHTTDIEEINIKNHDTLIIHEYNQYQKRDELHIFFSTGSKIFYIYYPKGHVSSELKQIIKSTPKSNITYEKFMDILNNAQKDYIDAERQINLELDLEEYYSDYNNNLNNFRYSFIYPDY